MFYSAIKPMEPITTPQPFDSDHHIFQVKWDGVRILSFVEKDRVRLENRKFRKRTDQYPEMQSLSRQVSCHDAILDGEMISLKNGKPSFSRILQRDLISTGIENKVMQIPVIYMVFDLLYLNGKNLTSLSWEERDEKLKKILRPSESIQITESIPGQGINFYQAVLNQKLEGIVAKERTSPYIIGGKTSHWQKIKPRRDMNCVIGGYILENGKIKSLLIGAYQEKKLKFLGKAGSGLSQSNLAELSSVLPSLNWDKSPFDPAPRKQNNWYWVKPILTLKVEYMEFTSEKQLRHPAIKGFLTMKPEECILIEE